ncbi:hypothetical protein FRC07_005362 [Ceratobasidium sp. 392]|nr:hypothetical protein FRC07_005362 [Ceratobasidium sp. 392]
MLDIASKTTPSSSRSLPPLRRDTTDRGRPRPKTRATNPDSYVFLHENTSSFSLPPIHPGTRGSRDEEHSPLPGMRVTISQAPASGKNFLPPIPRQPSVSAQRDDSDQSSPDTPSALSYILEDSSACSSPRPILPSIAHLDGTLLPNTLLPIGSGHVSPRSPVFELSDLRTHLPVDDSIVRVRPNPHSRGSIGSPKSTPLLLSRPMSPTGHDGSSSTSFDNQRFNLKPATTEREGQVSHYKKAQPQDKFQANKKALFVNDVPLGKNDDGTHSLGHHGHKYDQPATGGGSPIIKPIKVELDFIESPVAKSSKEVSDLFAPKFTGTSDGTISDRPRGLHANTDYDQDDTPTQTLSHSSQLPHREQSPLSTIDSSPVTATAAEPHALIIRTHSPHPKPSPLTATTSSSGNVPLDQIIAHLTEHGCRDLTSALDHSSLSVQPVSHGGYGSVYREKLSSGTQVAIKALRVPFGNDDEPDKLPKRAARELYIWSKCQHVNVLPLLGLVLLQGQIRMVSLWMENGSLPDYLNKHPELDRCDMSAQICDGVMYLHHTGIIHGDLKGNNVLVSEEGAPVITDFGNAVLERGTMQFTETMKLSGFTPRWTAPEILDEREVKQSKEADVYALGMAVAIKNEIPKRPEEHIPLHSQRGEVLWSLLKSCWEFEPEKRPDAGSVTEIMKGVTREGLMPTPAASEPSTEA